jgi:hypothetical protein
MWHALGEKRVVYRVLVGRVEGKKSLGRPRHRWEDNIKMDLREIGIDGVSWILLPMDMVQWWAFAKILLSLKVNGFLKMCTFGIFRILGFYYFYQVLK